MRGDVDGGEKRMGELLDIKKEAVGKEFQSTVNGRQ